MVQSDDKKVDVLISLAESCWKEFDSRRAYEWKVSFGLWTALGIIAGFALKENVVIPFNKCLLIAFLLIIFIAYCWFQYGLKKSNSNDQDKRHFFINSQILPLIGINIENLRLEHQILLGQKPPTSKGPFFQNWSHGSQILITAIFLLLLGLLLYNKDIKQSPEPKNPTNITINNTGCNKCCFNPFESTTDNCSKSKSSCPGEKQNIKHNDKNQCSIHNPNPDSK